MQKINCFCVHGTLHQFPIFAWPLPFRYHFITTKCAKVSVLVSHTVSVFIVSNCCTSVKASSIQDFFADYLHCVFTTKAKGLLPTNEVQVLYDVPGRTSTGTGSWIINTTCTYFKCSMISPYCFVNISSARYQ